MKAAFTYSSGVGQWLVLLLFFIIPNSGKAGAPDGKDSLRNKYALNDPRNPDCPCHKYQKMADDEYRRTQQQGVAGNEWNNDNPVQFANANFALNNFSVSNRSEGRSFSSSKKLHKKQSHAFLRHKRHRHSKKRPKLHRVFAVKDWELWKRMTDPTACYHWR